MALHFGDGHRTEEEHDHQADDIRDLNTSRYSEQDRREIAFRLMVDRYPERARQQFIQTWRDVTSASISTGEARRSRTGLRPFR